MARGGAVAWPDEAPDVMTGSAPADAGPAALAPALRRSMTAGDGAVPEAGGMELPATVLWSRFLRFDAADPHWADRDRFVLSSSRFQPLLRALLRLTGHGEVPPGCAFGAHPAVETAAGPPGQGFATAVGMAMAERALAARYGRTLVDHRTWVLACEADLAAGVSLEAAALAGQMGLNKLAVLSGTPPDAPGRGANGSAGTGPDAMTRFLASGWAVRRVDAGDPDAITSALTGALRGRRPTLIACHNGSPAGGADDDGAPDRPGDAGAAWLNCGQRGLTARRGWLRRLVRHRQHAEFERTRIGQLAANWTENWTRGWTLSSHRGASPSGIGGEASTLEAGRHGLALLRGLLPELVSLHSTAGAPLLPDPDGSSDPRDRAAARVAPCGVQEHGMAALANGLALHGGLRPVLAASFLSVDRMRPALRLGALMGQPVIYLLTGDGPAPDNAGSQPVEQLASLRAMPEVMVFRPADPAEVEACWALALGHDGAPSVIALSPRPSPHRHPAPGSDDNGGGDRREAARLGCARGGYVLAPADGAARATLIATGPEVAVALGAQVWLRRENIPVAVVSLPCWELFAAQPSPYREAILGKAPRIGIEAASPFGWERWLGPDGVFIGMDGFGATTTDTPHRRFGITPDAVAARVRRRLESQASGSRVSGVDAAQRCG